MGAGESALRRSTELNGEADALFDLVQQKRQLAHNFAAACHSEQELAEIVRPLSVLGWTVLEDRRWPGSKRANVDFLLVGPGGVVVLDAKHWAELEIRNGVVFRGDAREDDEVAKLARLVGSIVESIADTGLAAAAVSAAMVFTSHAVRATAVGPVTVVGAGQVVAWLAGLRQRFTGDQVTVVAAAIARACPEIDGDPLRPTPAPVKVQPRRLAEPSPALIDVEAITQSLLESALAGPIEDWMTFLHPDQNKLVRSHWNGPARIRGPAGTGKTVVGLHRAVYLAERTDRPVLVTSFVKTLPVVLSSLATRLSPNAAERIEFVGVHALAFRALERTGQKIRLDQKGADRAFQEAWRRTDAATKLGAVDERASYWKEEIDCVIKGRGLTEFGDYRELRRVGRKTPLQAADRAHVWDLYSAYEAELAEQGIQDFNDLLIRAKAAVDTYPDLFTYSAVIVDEVQDLNLAAFRFLAALAGDGPDRLLIIGDGQQSVYPGGFTLSEAGISVAGRGTVLRVNYRNTREILEEAARLVSTDTFEDLDGLPEPGRRDAEVPRRGYQPVRWMAERQAGLDSALRLQLTRTHAMGVPWGDLAVLVERRWDVRRYERTLRNAGIPHVDLREYDGRTTDEVKLGTFKRAKGLDFKYVLMPGLRTGPPEMSPGETSDSYAERCERLRRELYVGMTRARDGLWLGYLRS